MQHSNFRLLLLTDDKKRMESEIKKNEEFIRLFRIRNRELKEQIGNRNIEILKLSAHE